MQSLRTGSPPETIEIAWTANMTTGFWPLEEIAQIASRFLKGKLRRGGVLIFFCKNLQLGRGIFRHINTSSFVSEK